MYAYISVFTFQPTLGVISLLNFLNVIFYFTFIVCFSWILIMLIIFHVFLAICTSCFVSMYSNILLCVNFCLFFFFVFVFRHCDLNTSPLLDIYFANIYSCYMVYFSILLIMLFFLSDTALHFRDRFCPTAK